MSNELSTDLRTDKAAFEPTTISEALQISQVLVASRLLPRSISTPEAAFAVIATGRELGLSAMQALRSIHIVEGKPTLSADLMVALVKRHAACEFFRLVESSGARATYETQRRGEPSATRMSYTLDEARAAGALTKDNWRKFAASMLRARCASMLARAVYPDVVLGVYDPDEIVIDTPPSRVEVIAAPAARAEAPARRAAPAPVVEDAQVIDAPTGDPLHDAIAAAPSLRDASAVLAQAKGEGMSDDALVTAFGVLLERATTQGEANVIADLVRAWRDAGAVDAVVIEQLRNAYKARKAAVREVA